MEAEIKFEREEREGIAVVGTYLIDAAQRLGVVITDDCGRLGLCDTCAVTVTKGAEFLSAPTKAEIEQLSEKRRNNGERLACQAKIESEGEISILTAEKKEEIPVDKAEDYRKEFEELPLEKKISQLVKLEAIALGETFNFILSSPSKIVGMAMDVLAEFGLKMEDETKKATRPEEHQTKVDDEESKDSKGETPVQTEETDLETPIAAEERIETPAEEAPEIVTADFVAGEAAEPFFDDSAENSNDENHSETEEHKSVEN